jgi:SAM-dependent methyltransferase
MDRMARSMDRMARTMPSERENAEPEPDRTETSKTSLRTRDAARATPPERGSAKPKPARTVKSKTVEPQVGPEDAVNSGERQIDTGQERTVNRTEELPKQTSRQSDAESSKSGDRLSASTRATGSGERSATATGSGERSATARESGKRIATARDSGERIATARESGGERIEYNGDMSEAARGAGDGSEGARGGGGANEAARNGGASEAARGGGASEVARASGGSKSARAGGGEYGAYLSARRAAPAEERALSERYRNAMNAFKRFVYERHVPIGASVLDLGCGAGTDMLKFANLRVERYLGVDREPLAITEALERKAELLLKKGRSFASGYEFWVHDLNEVALCCKPRQQRFDVVNAQLCLHYLDRECALRTLDGCCAVGGAFIVTIIDSEALAEITDHPFISLRFSPTPAGAAADRSSYVFSFKSYISEAQERVLRADRLREVLRGRGFEWVRSYSFHESEADVVQHELRLHMNKSAELLGRLDEHDRRALRLYRCHVFRRVRDDQPAFFPKPLPKLVAQVSRKRAVDPSADVWPAKRRRPAANDPAM